MFASVIPEIVDILGTRSKYGGSYKKEHGKRYVIFYNIVLYDNSCMGVVAFLRQRNKG